ncbi:DUF934 domain-containing protein [Flagellatimonas centrodinii]|uniref:DUF934 domain-containing protein n=1 Tax=Flagellatimonas centrodinii TaxID=2806210 RepID=UPI001FFDACB8|nr:DUF934 domain-containing protein [Flagellatimonas centrodinii]ULQ46686.1 DUF934 domain-containing protein [Flagellatimonas centrodinii]
MSTDSAPQFLMDAQGSVTATAVVILADGEAGTADTDDTTLVLAPIHDADSLGAATGVPRLAPALSVTPLRDALLAQPRLALAFDSFGEGRPYSQARQLRAAGYQGQLIASGPAVVCDKVVPMRELGIDAFLFADESEAHRSAERLRAATATLPAPSPARAYRPVHRTGVI